MSTQPDEPDDGYLEAEVAEVTPYAEDVVRRAVADRRVTYLVWLASIITAAGAVGTMLSFQDSEPNLDSFPNVKFFSWLATALAPIYFLFEGMTRATTQQMLETLHAQERLEGVLETMMRQNPEMADRLRSIGWDHDIDLKR